jgi:hypothetical protein
MPEIPAFFINSIFLLIVSEEKLLMFFLHEDLSDHTCLNKTGRSTG